MHRPYGRRYLQPNNMAEKFYGGFEYVVTKIDPPRVCFGSSLDRQTLPQSGPTLSPFMRRMAPQVLPKLGPGSYETKRDAFWDYRTRFTSTRGLGPKEMRFKERRRDHQPPPQEPPPPKPIKHNCAPFNSTAKRKSLFHSVKVPAPCDYLPQFKRRTMKFSYSFNGKKVLKCPVEIKCVPYNLDTCGVCECSCSAQGDYWQFENRLFLCRRHYNRLFTHCLAKFQGVRLSDFKSVRDCFFAHAHNSCLASVKIMSKEAIEKKLRKEAYLDLYFPQRRFCEN